MTSRLPQRTTPPVLEDRVPPGKVVYEYSASGRIGGLGGLLLGALLLGAVVGLLLLGAIALTLALWLGLAAVVIGVLVALVRGVFGAGKPRPPR